MGIKNLHKFLRKHCPNVYVKKHLSEFRFKKIAIDISVYLFTYKIIFGEQWLDAFIKLISCLRKNDIHCVFIYDGKSPPEKKLEQQKRKNSRIKQQERINIVQTAIDTYYETNMVDDILLEIYKKKAPLMKTRLLGPNSFDIKICEQYLEKKKAQIITLSDNDFKSSKTLFDILGIPYFQSTSEGETMCAHLNLNKKVAGVLSEDTDLLAYGVESFLTKINTAKETCIEIKISSILTSLNLTQKQFCDFCILCGTDYNSNISRVGPEKAFKLITEDKCIENIEKHDTTILNYKRGRELFSNDVTVNVYIPFCKPPDFQRLKGFLFNNNCKIHLNSIKNTFEPQKLQFIEK